MASDVYAVGCIGIEMLTGEPPWPDHEPLQALFSVGNNSVKQIRTSTPLRFEIIRFLYYKILHLLITTSTQKDVYSY